MICYIQLKAFGLKIKITATRIDLKRLSSSAVVGKGWLHGSCPCSE